MSAATPGKDPIILVHGAWGSARSWDALVELLRARGREVQAIDLPGHGEDPAEPGGIGLADYARRVAEVARSCGPALLVGHSMGGMAISAGAELAPDMVRKLVYVTAFLPRDGQSLLDLIRQQDAPGVQHAVRPGPAPGCTVLDGAQAAQALFQDATPEQQRAAIASFGPQPNRAQTDRVRLTAENFGAIPRAYIACTRDRTITPALQRAMVAASPCPEILSLDSGHVPQLTQPERLAELLDSL